jgi:hypothetical protein
MLVLAVAAGCSNFDYHISNSVFIEDSENPGLPIYSEKGYNSFGFYQGLSVVSTWTGHDPSRIDVKDDSCHINLSGSNGITLKVSLPGYIPETFNELLSLNGKNFDLTKPEECTIALLYSNMPQHLEILEGSFTIKRAQNLYVDKKMEGVVLSGVFSFKAIMNDTPTTFSNGRFDMRFGDENFFYLQKL